MTKLAFIGDIHGEFWVLPELMKRIPEDAKIIQVGDFGYWPQLEGKWRDLYLPVHRTIYFIDGNHDYIPGLDIRSHLPTPIWDGRAIYVPRGMVMSVDGVGILFCGGAKSLDRAWRPKDGINHGWFEDEQLTEADIEHAVANVERVGGIDVMVTHAPPDDVVRKCFPESGLKMFDINPATWIDESARLVQQLHEELGKPPLFCGHMHRSVKHEAVTILDINEIAIWEK